MKIIAMLVKRLLVVTTIVALFGTCNGQRMRKRITSPVVDIDNFVKSNGMDQDYRDITKRGLHAKSSKQSSKQGRTATLGDDSEGDLFDFFLAKNVRLDGVRMSMPSSPSNPSTPVQRPSPRPTTRPGDAPVPTQGSDCQSLSRREAMTQSLGKLTDPSILNDFSTPQGKAFVWILDRDTAQIDPCNDAGIEQRFALATFYYSTNGGNWDNSARWITDPNECSWIGIRCDGNGQVTELGANAALSKSPTGSNDRSTYLFSRFNSLT